MPQTEPTRAVGTRSCNWAVFRVVYAVHTSRDGSHDNSLGKQAQGLLAPAYRSGLLNLRRTMTTTKTMQTLPEGPIREPLWNCGSKTMRISLSLYLSLPLSLCLSLSLSLDVYVYLIHGMFVGT